MARRFFSNSLDDKAMIRRKHSLSLDEMRRKQVLPAIFDFKYRPKLALAKLKQIRGH